MGAFSSLTSNGVAYVNGSGQPTSGSALVFDGANLGLGVTPSAWQSAYKALQVGKTAVWWANSASDDWYIGNNYYYDGSLKRISTGYATEYAQYTGKHVWSTAGTAAAGSAVTFTQAMTLAASGGLSIGTTTDAGAGNILVGNGQVIASNGSGTAYAARLSCAYNYPTVDTYLDSVAGASYSGQIMFRTSSGGGAMTERARIDSSGNLLVGTTTAAGKLTVNGSNSSGAGSIQGANASNLNILMLNAPNFPLGVNASNGGSVEFVRFYSGGTTAGTISYNGTATLYNATSDQRLKENIVNAQEFGNVIDSIQVREFDWKSNGSHQRAGFIAQELVTVAPEAVYQPADAEEMMAVDYSKLVPMLVKEIQSLRKRLADAGIA
jgi:hypothetical protein